MTASIHRTFCRNCGSSCGLLVETEENRILNVSPDREHPMTHGYMCIKGVMSGEIHSGAGRLTKAQRGDRHGSMEPIQIQDALDLIAARLNSIIEVHGPKAIALYFG